VTGVCTENLIRVDAVMESPKLAVNMRPKVPPRIASSEDVTFA
jgi:hypothetical protein